MSDFPISPFQYPFALIGVCAFLLALLFLKARKIDDAVGMGALIVGGLLFGIYSLPEQVALPALVRMGCFLEMFLSVAVWFTYRFSKMLEKGNN